MTEGEKTARERMTRAELRRMRLQNDVQWLGRGANASANDELAGKDAGDEFQTGREWMHQPGPVRSDDARERAMRVNPQSIDNVGASKPPDLRTSNAEALRFGARQHFLVTRMPHNDSKLPDDEPGRTKMPILRTLASISRQNGTQLPVNEAETPPEQDLAYLRQSGRGIVGVTPQQRQVAIATQYTRGPLPTAFSG
jgi:hypothetical protein